MAHVVRPLMQLSRWRRCCSTRAALNRLLTASSPFASNTSTTITKRLPRFLSFSYSSFRNVHFRSRALRLRDTQSSSDSADESDDGDSSDGVKKSRNEKKREARRAVRWGMQLANFSPTQIKRILRVASLEQEVFDAIMLVKRLGRDVREGKRRQFNLIGKMLRKVEPELMDSLIQITKDSDKEKFVALFGSDAWDIKDNDYEAEEIDYDDDDDDDDEDSQHYDLATRWYDGLISKDIGITNEIYSLQGVEFDRQELRRLVRRIHSMQEHQISSEKTEDKTEAKFTGAKRSLTRFLRGLATQTSVE